MAEKVAEGVWRVTGSRTNLYIVTDGGSSVLVDTGCPSDIDAISSAFEQLGWSLADLSAVLLTHAHYDHVGSAERIRERDSVTVYTHAYEAANARGDRVERISNGYMLSRLWWPKMLSFLARSIRSGVTKVEFVREVSTFGEQSTVLDFAGGLVPVFTPGHTSGHCGFHLPQRGVLITGDALVTQDPLTGATGPRLMHRAFNHDHQKAMRSLDVLRDLAADVVLPGHGEPFCGSPTDAVDQAIIASASH